MIRRISGAAVLALALALSVPSIASADVTIGSTTQPSGSSTTTTAIPAATNIQTGSASFPAAVPAGGGRITQWSTNTAGATPGTDVKLVVVRPASGGTYTVLAVDSETLPNPLPASGVATFTVAAPIPVSAGDQIGLNTPTGTTADYWTGGATPASDTLGVYSTASPSPPAPGQTIQSFASGSARANVSAVVNQAVDAGVTTSTAPARPSVGNLAVLGSTVTNHSSNSEPVTFTDTVPNGLAINSAFAANGSCNISGQTVTCTIPSLGGGSSVPVNVLVTPNATGSYANHVSVAPGGGFSDPNPSNNSASATLNVRKLATNACTVLRLRGATARDAKRALKQLGCKVKVKRKRGKGVPHGAVLKTKPGFGTYKLGRKITVIVRK